MKYYIYWMNPHKQWQRYITKTNQADAFRVMERKAKSDGRRYKLTDESGNLLDLSLIHI